MSEKPPLVLPPPPPSRRWGTSARAFVIGAGLVLFALFLYWVRSLLPPIIIAMAASYGLLPLVRFLEKRTKMRHGLAVASVYLLGLIFLIAAPGTLIPVAIRQGRNAIGDITRFQQQLELLLSEPIRILGNELQFGEVFSDLINSTTNAFTLQAGNLLILLETTSISFAWLIIVLVCSYYFLLDSHKLRDWAVGLAPPGSREDLERLINEVGSIWQAYVGGTLVLVAITATVMSLVWLAIGLPGAVAVGLFTGLLVLIPEIGTILGGILAVLIAYFLGPQFLPVSNVAFAVVVGILHILLTQARARWLQPRLHGRRLRMHPGIVFVAIMGALVLQGILAALAAVPILATARFLGHYARCRLFELDPWEGYFGFE